MFLLALRHLRGKILELRVRQVQIQRRFRRIALQHPIPRRQRPAQVRDHLGLQFLVASGLGGLALQRIYLPPHFFQNVEHARQVLFRAFQLGFRQPLLGFEFADARGFFDDGPPVLRLVAQDLPDAALLDDGVAFGAQAGADEEVLDVAQPRDFAVDQVFALARSKQPPRDGDFAGLVRGVTVTIGVAVACS